MRSANDPITGLKNQILEWGVVEESTLKTIDKEARHEVEVAVEEAKKSPEPSQETDMWTDIYYKGTNPAFMRGRERNEVRLFVFPSFVLVLTLRGTTDSSLQDERVGSAAGRTEAVWFSIERSWSGM